MLSLLEDSRVDAKSSANLSKVGVDRKCLPRGPQVAVSNAIERSTDI